MRRQETAWHRFRFRPDADSDMRGPVHCEVIALDARRRLALTWQDVDRVRRDCDRDYWMSAEEAKEYGVVDRVLVRDER